MRRLAVPAVLSIALTAMIPGAAAPQDSVEQQIRSALSAAPSSVAEHATVALADGTILRQGSSDWVCLPDMPHVPNNSPMCLDATWRSFMDALMNKRAPTVTQVGIAYMLQGEHRRVLTEISPEGQDQGTAAAITVIRGDAHLALGEQVFPGLVGERRPLRHQHQYPQGVDRHDDGGDRRALARRRDHPAGRAGAAAARDLIARRT